MKEGAEKGVSIPSIAAAMDARMLSSKYNERKIVSQLFPQPDISKINEEQIISDLSAALYASKICSYAQGLSLIRATSDEYKWDVDLSECARLWMGGCIVQAKLLERVYLALKENKNLSNLLIDPSFAAEINERVDSWRSLVALCVLCGIACPSLSGSLTYLDTYRRDRLPANLIRAQRAFLGVETDELIDKEQ
jgi:6-phosphogluconate dehydrogenase